MTDTKRTPQIKIEKGVSGTPYITDGTDDLLFCVMADVKGQSEQIVRACNAHDGLVEALGRIKKHAADYMVTVASEPDGPLGDIYKMADAALAKAEGNQ